MNKIFKSIHAALLLLLLLAGPVTASGQQERPYNVSEEQKQKGVMSLS